MDREGYLVILNSANQRVLKLAPNGTIRTVPLDGPVMAVDAERNLFFAGTYGQLIPRLGHP